MCFVKRILVCLNSCAPALVEEAGMQPSSMTVHLDQWTTGTSAFRYALFKPCGDLWISTE